MFYGLRNKILVLLVTDVLSLSGIKEQVANRSYQRIDTKGQVRKEEIQTGSGGISCGLQRSVVDDDATDPTQEKSQKETDEIVVVFHCHGSPFILV